MKQTVQDTEAVLSFLYAAPAALAQASPQGHIEMMTPLFSQWLMPLAGPQRFGNLFDLLDCVVPDLRQRVGDFTPASGLICNSELIEVPAGPASPQTRLWALSVLKLDPQRLMVMLSDESPRLQERHTSRQVVSDLRTTLEDVLSMAQMCLLREDIASGLIVPDARLSAWCGLSATDPPMTLDALLRLLHPDDRATYAQEHARARAGQAGAFHDLRIQRADGTLGVLSGRHGLVCGSDGRPATLLLFGLDVTEQRRVEHERLALGEHLSLATASIGIGTFEVLAQQRQLNWTRQTYALYGCADQSGREPSEILELVMSPEQRARHHDWVEAALSGTTPPDLECLIQPPGAAQARWLLCQGSLRRDADGKVVSIIGITRDVTERHRIEAELRLAAAAFDVQEGMLITDPQGRIERVNRAGAEMTGYPGQELVGQHLRVLKSGLHEPSFYRAIDAALRRDGSWAGEVWQQRRNGTVFPTWLTSRRVISADPEMVRHVITLVDIAQRKADEQRIEQLAYYDGLTGLANRNLFKNRLRVTLDNAHGSACRGAVICIDLDHFKELNERRGHDVGDALLQQVAQRLRACAASGDLVARLGADEFVLLMHAEPQASIDAVAKQASALAEQLLATLQLPIQLGGETHQGGASIGVALLDQWTDSVAEVMRRTDMALHQAKKAGRRAVRFFDVAVQEAVWQSARLEEELRHAIQHDELRLYLQPIVAHDGSLRGAEALVRWQHPRQGLVMPGVFIPLAEERGLIRSLTAWVLEAACRQLATWQACPRHEALTLSVNISARDLHDEHFVDEVVGILARTGADPNRLKLELTESMLLDNVDKAIDRMQTIRRMGVHFALDDFGTGYASLSYLRRLPLDKLKIDQSFVRNLLTDPADASIARMIIDLARNLNIMVVAEGVETQAQHQCLMDFGCLFFQGYLFGRPGPVEQLERQFFPAAGDPILP
jgi:diguanylate cyclase (GGDEF)-like protein/PAS domain S-box-containing protein